MYDFIGLFCQLSWLTPPSWHSHVPLLSGLIILLDRLYANCRYMPVGWKVFQTQQSHFLASNEGPVQTNCF
jgi:hypothetical protein